MKSTCGNIGDQIYVLDKGFVKVYTVKAEREFISTLWAFAEDVVVPDVLVCDSAKTQTKKEVKDFANKIGTTLCVLKNETQWADQAELYIGLIQESTKKIPVKRTTHLSCGITPWNDTLLFIKSHQRIASSWTAPTNTPQLFALRLKYLAFVSMVGINEYTIVTNMPDTSTRRNALVVALALPRMKKMLWHSRFLTQNIQVVTRRAIRHPTKAELALSN